MAVAMHDVEAVRAARLAHTEQIKIAALRIDISNTEEITARDLAEGDVIVHLGMVEFPFPFTLTKAQAMPRFRKMNLAASHGWVAVVNENDRVIRVVKER